MIITPRTVRKIHKWVMWVIGLQFLIWCLSGLYFTLFDIHYIRGQSLQETHPEGIDIGTVEYDFHDVLADFPDAQNIKLYSLGSRLVYQLTEPLQAETLLVDALTKEVLSGLSKQDANHIAIAAFTGTADITSTIEFVESAPSELSSRYLPAWQVKFDDAFNSTLYISQKTGEVITRRHDWWRLFDLFWRLHIIDPFEGEDISNPWLFGASLLGLFSLFTGLLLSWYTLFKPAMKRRAVV